MNAGRSAATGLLLSALTAPGVWATAAPPVDPGVTRGEAIYLRGVLASGAPLQAERGGGGTTAKGLDAACVNCHQRSGLGATHQSNGIGAGSAGNVIPPIAARYLLRSGSTNHDAADLPFVEGMRTNRAPYTEATLARAIREGIDSEGRQLTYLMPRFAIDDADMASLIDYLKTLDPTRVPGVTATVLHFATIITPDADPVKRRGMLDVMEKYFAERNSRQMVPSARLRASDRTQYSRTMFMVHRQWELHVWELTGPAGTWKKQLEQHLAKEPVLAVISGLGRSNWAPVHEFCEKQALPCLFPNVEVPVDARGDFYNLYFSKGVLLEAELIARRILDRTGSPPVRVVHQIYRAADSGESAARALAADLRHRGIAVHDHVVAAGDQGLQPALRDATGGDALVLWLRPRDVAALGQAPAVPTAVYMSGLMGGLEGSPLPPSWRTRTQLAYPFDLPQTRVARVDYPMGWFRIRRIPVVDEQVQVDTNLACGLLSEVLSHLVDTFERPYLIEQLQAMVEHRVVTGYYPRLTLAENQHFASKGGYLVHFAQDSGTRLAPDSDWVVP
jgi:hypothetical protein